MRLDLHLLLYCLLQVPWLFLGINCVLGGSVAELAERMGSIMKANRQLIMAGVCLLVMLAGASVIRSQDKPRPDRRDRAFDAAAPQDGRARPFPPDPTFNFVGS